MRREIRQPRIAIFGGCFYIVGPKKSDTHFKPTIIVTGSAIQFEIKV